MFKMKRLWKLILAIFIISAISMFFYSMRIKILTEYQKHNLIVNENLEVSTKNALNQKFIIKDLNAVIVINKLQFKRNVENMICTYDIEYLSCNIDLVNYKFKINNFQMEKDIDFIFQYYTIKDTAGSETNRKKYVKYNYINYVAHNDLYDEKNSSKLPIVNVYSLTLVFCVIFFIIIFIMSFENNEKPIKEIDRKPIESQEEVADRAASFCIGTLVFISYLLCITLFFTYAINAKNSINVNGYTFDKDIVSKIKTITDSNFKNKDGSIVINDISAIILNNNELLENSKGNMDGSEKVDFYISKDVGRTLECKYNEDINILNCNNNNKEKYSIKVLAKNVNLISIETKLFNKYNSKDIEKLYLNLEALNSFYKISNKKDVMDMLYEEHILLGVFWKVFFVTITIFIVILLFIFGRSKKYTVIRK